MQYNGAGNTTEENSSIFSITECTNWCRQKHAGSETLLQQNPPVLNWRCRLVQVVMYNGRKMVVSNAVMKMT